MENSVFEMFFDCEYIYKFNYDFVACVSHMYSTKIVYQFIIRKK